MNITLCSAFRNATPYLATYFNQVNALDYELHKRGDRLQLVWGEGDSTDGTLSMLKGATFRFRANVIDCTHGGKVFGSIEDTERFDQLAYVGNCIWQAIPADTDAVVYIESDLLWQPETIIGLLEGLTAYPAVSPMVMHIKNPGLYKGEGPFFYDRWAFRRNGVRFTNEPPYHVDIGKEMLRLDSAGSCIAIRYQLAQNLYFPNDCFVGVSRLIHEQGGEIWLDPELKVFHS